MCVPEWAACCVCVCLGVGGWTTESTAEVWGVTTNGQSRSETFCRAETDLYNLLSKPNFSSVPVIWRTLFFFKCQGCMSILRILNQSSTSSQQYSELSLKQHPTPRWEVSILFKIMHAADARFFWLALLLWENLTNTNVTFLQKNLNTTVHFSYFGALLGVKSLCFYPVCFCSGCSHPVCSPWKTQAMRIHRKYLARSESPEELVKVRFTHNLLVTGS